MVNHVVTTLLCAADDPVRHIRWEPDGALLDTLCASVTGAEVTVLADRPLHGGQGPAIEVEVPAGANPYHHRWAVIADWLTTIGGADLVWCVDATDVEMLREPWEHMAPGTLYCGSEDATWSLPWMVDLHPSIRDVAADQPLRNAGLLGGAVPEVRDFVAMVLDDLAGCPEDTTDMAAFNRTVELWACSGPVVTGPQVHTRLRGFEHDHPTAWWRHK